MQMQKKKENWFTCGAIHVKVACSFSFCFLSPSKQNTSQAMWEEAKHDLGQEDPLLIGLFCFLISTQILLGFS